MKRVPTHASFAKTSEQRLPFLGGLSAEQFMAQHWQKAPLFIPGAVRDLPTVPSPEELLGLACEEDIAARLVKFTRGTWQLQSGPFEPEQLSRLPARNWTVLISDLEEHLPDLGVLLAHLDFLPSWRIDDLMASFAVPGGSVGPHYDSYDVFLLQVQGERRWQISENFDPARLRTDSQLRILADFTPEQEWVCRPGDMLYLPPHVAHYGLALTPCTTFSLGCRAPNLRELATHFATRVLDALPDTQQYADPGAKASAQRYTLDDSAVRTARSMLQSVFALDEHHSARALASLVTQPKALFERGSRESLAGAVVARRLKARRGLERRKGSRWLYLQLPSGVELYVDGDMYLCAGELKLAQTLCAERHFDAQQLQRWQSGSAQQNSVLRALVAAGQLVPH